MQEQYTPPDIHLWKFTSELSAYTYPVFRNQPGADQLIFIRKSFPDKSDVLETAYESLTRHFTAAGYRFTSDAKKPDFTPEQYRVSIRGGEVEIAAGEPEGVRRGIYALIDVLCENSGKLPEELQIARKCHRFGIRVYLLMIEPFGVLQDDELLKEHPEMFRPVSSGVSDEMRFGSGRDHGTESPRHGRRNK